MVAGDPHQGDVDRFDRQLRELREELAIVAGQIRDVPATVDDRVERALARVVPMVAQEILAIVRPSCESGERVKMMVANLADMVQDIKVKMDSVPAEVWSSGEEIQLEVATPSNPIVMEDVSSGRAGSDGGLLSSKKSTGQESLGRTGSAGALSGRVCRERKSQFFNGKGSWSDYRFGFEAVAEWNGWQEDEKSAQLIMSLLGRALHIGSSQSVAVKRCYSSLVKVLQQTFDPPEREIAH